MARSVYVTALEPGTGKSAVVLGLTEALTRRAGQVGFFRPLIASDAVTDPDIDLIRGHYGLPQTYRASYAATGQDLHDVSSRESYDALFKRVLTGYRSLERDADAVVIDGSDFVQASRAVEADFNIDIANHLGAPMLLVVGGKGRDADHVLDAARLALATVIDRGCTVLGTVCNRVDPEILQDVRRQLPSLVGAGVAFAMPELSMLAAPTLAQVAAALDARYLQPAEGAASATAHREVSRVIIGAMGLPAFLERVGEDDLLITPGDRADLIAGCLAAHLSGAYPPIAGLLLTGGLVSEPILKLIAGFDDQIPVIEVDTDTYSTATAVSGLRGSISVHTTRKIASVLELFEEHGEVEQLVERMAVSRSDRVTPLMFEHDLIARARAAGRHIVLPEGSDDRILQAAEQLLRGGVVQLTILGSPEAITKRATTLGLDLPGVRLVDPATSPWLDDFAEVYHRARAHKGVTLELARETMLDVSYFGTMMVHRGLADGMVSGAVNTTAHTIRPAFEFVRTAPGVSVVSSVFLMCLSDRVLVYGDCAVIPNPNAEQLAEIAISAASTASMFGIEPRIALLSYSTGKSGSGADVEKVRAAAGLARERRPDLLIEGPIQYDAAIDPEVARTKLPDSQVAGRATVFVFPDLNTGNNTYKAVQRSAGALAIGPILQGLAKPVNDLSRGALVPDIVNTVAITAIQAGAAVQAAAAVQAGAGTGASGGPPGDTSTSPTERQAGAATEGAA
jgi:phosphate acetyltransferase